MLSLQQLSQFVTRSEVSSWLIATLQGFGYQATGWQPGRIQTTILNAIASVGSAWAEVASVVAAGSYSETATSELLTQYSASRFSNEREPALPAIGAFDFVNAGAVPYVVAPGALLITDDSGTEFYNSAGGTIAANATTSLQVTAVLAGSSGNIGNGATLTLVTSLSGVTVTNPGPGSGVAWYTVQAGRDEETDVELRRRNSTKWGRLSVEKTSTAMENIALSLDGINKVRVIANNPRGPFTLDIYVSGSSSLVSTGQITAAQEAFGALTFGTESVWPPTDTPLPSSVRLYHATTQELVITGAVYYDPQFSVSDVQLELAARLDALIAVTPLGGKNYASGVSNRLTLGDIMQTIEGTRGIVSASLTAPTGDVNLAATDLLVAPADWVAGRLTFAPAVDV